MIIMFQRHLGASSNCTTRHVTSELVASPGGISRPASRNNSFSRLAPSGGLGGIPNSRSRKSLLIACSSANGPAGEGSFSESSNENPSGQGHSREQSQQSQSGGSNDKRSPDPAHASSHPPSAYSERMDNKESWDFNSELYTPNPMNLPTNETDEPLIYPPRPLRPLPKDIWTWTDQPGVDLFRAGPATWNRLRQVYVILFGVGERDTEGIYSLRAFGSDGIPHETIIAFECEEDAQRYAGLLEASMDHIPHVCSIPPRELLTFCQDQTYSCRLEPTGSLLIPPDFNVSVTDWERSLRLRDGKFAVLETEPEYGFGVVGGGGGGATTATAAVKTAPPALPAGGQLGGGGGGGDGGSGGIHLNEARGSGAGSHPSTLARYSGLSGEELAEIRTRLESLLPKDSGGSGHL